MNHNILLELSQKLNISWDEIKRYHCVFKDIGIVPGSVSIISEPKTIVDKVGPIGHREKREVNQDGVATAKQQNGNNIVIVLRQDKNSDSIKVAYSLFRLDDGLYFVHNYQQSNMGDTIEFSYYDEESCNTVIKQGESLSDKTLDEFENLGIRSDYDETTHVFDIDQKGGFSHYVSKIDKASRKRKSI